MSRGTAVDHTRDDIGGLDAREDEGARRGGGGGGAVKGVVREERGGREADGTGGLVVGRAEKGAGEGQPVGVAVWVGEVGWLSELDGRAGEEGRVDEGC